MHASIPALNSKGNNSLKKFRRRGFFASDKMAGERFSLERIAFAYGRVCNAAWVYYTFQRTLAAPLPPLICPLYSLSFLHAIFATLTATKTRFYCATVATAFPTRFSTPIVWIRDRRMSRSRVVRDGFLRVDDLTISERKLGWKSCFNQITETSERSSFEDSIWRYQEGPFSLTKLSTRVCEV